MQALDVLAAEIDLVLLTVHREGNGPLGGAAVEVIDENDSLVLGHGAGNSPVSDEHGIDAALTQSVRRDGQAQRNR